MAILLGVATIAQVIPKGQGVVPDVLIHFDNWSDRFDYIAPLNDADLHPAGFCKATGYQLQAPKGYPGEFKWFD